MNEFNEQVDEQIDFSEEQLKILEDGLLSPEQVWTKEDIEPISINMNSEIASVEGLGDVVLTSNPLGVAPKLDCIQGGDNPYKANGTCTLVSISNLRVLAGQESSEPEVVKYAWENNLCEKEIHPESGVLGGGMEYGQELEVLEHYGMSAHVELKDIADNERIAQLIEGGHGVILHLNSGISQDREWKVTRDENENLKVNHAVCMTGTVRDIDTGELKGFYLCDSSADRADGASIYLSVDDMNKCYAETIDGGIVVTDDPIRSDGV